MKQLFAILFLIIFIANKVRAADYDLGIGWQYQQIQYQSDESSSLASLNASAISMTALISANRDFRHDLSLIHADAANNTNNGTREKLEITGFTYLWAQKIRLMRSFKPYVGYGATNLMLVHTNRYQVEDGYLSSSLEDKTSNKLYASIGVSDAYELAQDFKFRWQTKLHLNLASEMILEVGGILEYNL
jgi:hypothetical protein